MAWVYVERGCQAERHLDSGKVQPVGIPKYMQQCQDQGDNESGKRPRHPNRALKAQREPCNQLVWFKDSFEEELTF